MRRLILVTFFLITRFTSAQEIAITFDDAPTSDGPIFAGTERTDQILQHLKKQQVQQVAFFILTSNINSQNQERLRKYTKEGHLLANHTHRHQRIHEMGTNAYVRDIAIADSILRLKSGFVNWFRYPFLDEGRSHVVRDSLRTALKNLNLKNGYVTVDNYDWYLNNLVKLGLQSNKTFDKEELRPKELVQNSEDEEYLDALVRDAHIFECDL